MSKSVWHEKLFDAAIKAHQQVVKPRPPLAAPVRKKAPKEKKMKDELKLYRITIAPRPNEALVSENNALDGGYEILVVGTDGDSACAKILDEMPDSPIISASRITITEIKGPFQHGSILDFKPF